MEKDEKEDKDEIEEMGRRQVEMDLGDPGSRHADGLVDVKYETGEVSVVAKRRFMVAESWISKEQKKWWKIKLSEDRPRGKAT